MGYASRTNQTLSSNYYYGTSYNFNASTKTFILSGEIEQKTWNNSTASSLIGKYTCKSATEDGTCSTLYLIESYNSSTKANVIPLNSNSNYSQFGTLQFNASYNSPAYVGYMYGDVYAYSIIANTNTINYHYGESVTYDGEKYTLVNPKTFTTTPVYTDISNNHYICLTQNSDTCDKVGYVYYYTGSGTMYYITLKDGETSVNTALDKMLNQNTTSSTIKIGLEAWYERNLLSYSSYIEDTIYCNDRSYKNFKSSGWNENGGKTDTNLQFKEYSVTSDLSCTKQTDQFSTSNESAKLKYPIGLATSPEMNILNNATVRKTGQWYWLASPIYFNDINANERYVNYVGNIYYNYVNGDSGVRPAVSLISGTEYVSGDGSTDNPYIVK